MDITDYVVLAAIIVSAVVGLARGFLREAIALVTWIVALVLAGHFSGLVEPHLGGLLAGPLVKPLVARLIVLVLVLLAGAMIGAAAGHFVRLSIFSGMDRFLGFTFGALRGLLLLGLFVMLGQLMRLETEPWWRNSRLIPYGESVANGLRFLVGEEAASVHGRDVRV
ncbi:MAG TPA: CvpA family protein [Steroidobacteraceae bacterium]|nr:CvpA family protein [Steroidobacteraceae bacterium]